MVKEDSGIFVVLGETAFILSGCAGGFVVG